MLISTHKSSAIASEELHIHDFFMQSCLLDIEDSNEKTAKKQSVLLSPLL